MTKFSFVTFYDSIALGIRSLTSYLQSHGHEVQLVFLKNLCRSPIEIPKNNPAQYQIMVNGKLFGFGYDNSPFTVREVELMLKTMSEFQPDIIGISTRSFFDDHAIDISKKIKGAMPDVLIIGGGYGPTLSYERYLETFDLVVLGEGEEACLELGNALDAGEPWQDIRNIAYRLENKCIKNRLRKPEANLSVYPSPVFNYENTYTIEDDCVQRKDPTQNEQDYSVFVGRGCVGKCSYCSAGNLRLIYKQDGFTLPPRRNRCIKDIIHELVDAKKHGFSRVSFRDEFLVASPEYLQELFTQYKDHVGLPFFAYIHPRILELHPNIIDLMIQGGFDTSAVGIQTGSESFAKDVYCRTNKNEHIINFATALIKKGLRVDYHFIGANPLETEDDYRQTLELVARLPFDPFSSSLSWHYFTAFPGSPILLKLEAKSMRNRDALEWFRKGALLYLRVALNDEQFRQINQDATIEEIKQYIDDTTMLLVESGRLTDLSFAETEEKLFRSVAQKYRGKEVFAFGYGGRFHQKRALIEGCLIKAILDNNADLHGQHTKDGIPILPPEVLTVEPRAPIFIFSAYKKEIVQQIRKMGVDYPIP